MSTVLEIGPYHHTDQRVCSENYSDNRSLDRIYTELQNRGFDFSFEEHLRRVRATFPDLDELHILDGGCGKGNALRGLREIGKKLGIPLRTTGITMDHDHKAPMVENIVDEIVIGTVQHFFQIEDRTEYYHFILDYCGALAASRGYEILPIYRRVLARQGSALLGVYLPDPLLRNQVCGGAFRVGIQSHSNYLVFKHSSTDDELTDVIRKILE